MIIQAFSKEIGDSKSAFELCYKLGQWESMLLKQISELEDKL